MHARGRGRRGDSPGGSFPKARQRQPLSTTTSRTCTRQCRGIAAARASGVREMAPPRVQQRRTARSSETVAASSAALVGTAYDAAPKHQIPARSWPSSELQAKTTARERAHAAPQDGKTERLVAAPHLYGRLPARSSRAMAPKAGAGSRRCSRRQRGPPLPGSGSTVAPCRASAALPVRASWSESGPRRHFRRCLESAGTSATRPVSRGGEGSRR